EMGFSESTFVLEAERDRYRMRIFTPEREMPFAGHPTLGTAFVLAAEGRIGPSATQAVTAGEFGVEVDLGEAPRASGSCRPSSARSSPTSPAWPPRSG